MQVQWYSSSVPFLQLWYLPSCRIRHFFLCYYRAHGSGRWVFTGCLHSPKSSYFEVSQVPLRQYTPWGLRLLFLSNNREMSLGIFLVIAFTHLPSLPLALLGCIFCYPLPCMWELLFLREVKEISFPVFPPRPFSNCYQVPPVFSGYRTWCYSTPDEWCYCWGRMGRGVLAEL